MTEWAMSAEHVEIRAGSYLNSVIMIKEACMDGVDIIKSVDRFIDSRMYHYALLINGGWGTGKTFFVKETLIPHIEKSNKDVHYISLYGIQSADEISQMLLAQIITGKYPAAETKKGQIVTNVMSLVFKSGMNYLGLEKTDIVSAVKDIPNYDQSVFIFDDLERCGCSINEVLGYINNFVEHSDVSVIIIANEEEIGKWQLDRNPELQMLIAMDSRIDINLPMTTEDVSEEGQKDTNTKQTAFTPEEIEYRRQVIFHSNEKYRAVKEKVIGLTIDYEPDLSSIFQTLIEKNITYQPLKDELLMEVDWFVLTSEKDRHKNLRTFQYFLEKISVIFQMIKTDYPSLHQLIIRYTFRSAIRYMKGRELPKWDGDYGEQSFGDNQFGLDREFGFRFIDDLLLNNDIDGISVANVLTRFVRVAEMKALLNDDPYRLIQEWQSSEDEQVSEWLDGILKNVQDGKYSIELYPELIKDLAELYSNDVLRDKCTLIFKKIEHSIRYAEADSIEELEHRSFILNESSKKLYDRKIRRINQLIKLTRFISEEEKYIAAIQDGENWATNLLELSTNDRSIQGHSFIYWLNPRDILMRIEDSTNSELSQFRRALMQVYDLPENYEKKKEDYKKLKFIRRRIEELASWSTGEVKRGNLNRLKDDLEKYLEILEPDRLKEDDKSQPKSV